MTVYNYGDYARLARDPRVKTVFRGLEQAAKRTGVGYALVGGMAAYLYSKNPPEDYPDIDVMLDATASRAMDFIIALKRIPKWRLWRFDEGIGSDIFSSWRYDEAIDLDILTSQEDRRKVRRPVKKQGTRLEGIEFLIIEKIVERGSYEDILMAIDLLASRPYSAILLYELAGESKMTGRVGFLERIARAYTAGKLTQAHVRLVAKRVSGGLSHRG